MADIKQNDVVHDADLLGEKADMSHEETMHFAALTEEERIIEKKLKRRIDSLIMPLVVLVYLLNYIGMSTRTCGPLLGLILVKTETTTRRRVYKVSRRISDSQVRSIRQRYRSSSSA
jgi:hypothetical protein